MHQEHPEMVKDQYWDEVFPAELPYTVASKLYQTGPPPGSADNVEVSLEQAEFIPLETVAEEAQEEVDNFGDIEVNSLFLPFKIIFYSSKSNYNVTWWQHLYGK